MKSNLENIKFEKKSNDKKHLNGQYFTVAEENIELSIKNLDVHYKSKIALSNMSFDIPRQKVIAIVGQSGCGKTTLLKCFNRMNDYVPHCLVKGAIFLNGMNILLPKINTAELRSKIGMVFQKPNPFSMSIYDNVAYGPRIHGIKKRKLLDSIVKRALKHSGLYEEVKDNLNQNALSLSGGQQQRVCIARALALEPEIILFDEPTSALDPIATDVIENLIIRLKKYYTIIIITHSLKQALRISDYTMYLQKGKLIEYNDTKKIFINPKSKKTRKYLFYSGN